MWFSISHSVGLLVMDSLSFVLQMSLFHLCFKEYYD